MNIDERKKLRGFKRLSSSLKFAWEGLVYSYKNEQSFTLHLIATILVIIAGFIFKISNYEWIIIVLCIFLVLAFELVNTSVEALVDLITTEKNKYAKIAKDVAATTSVMFSIGSIIIGLIIFIPKIITMIRGLL